MNWKSRAGCIRILALVALGLAILWGAGWILASLSPSGWIAAETIRDDPESDRRGCDLEQNLAAAITRVRDPGASWAIRIQDLDVNAWIACRLPQWKDHDPTLAWPIEGATARLRFDRDCATILIEMDGRIWSGSFEMIVEAGGIRLVPGWGAVGMLPIPDGARLASRWLEGVAADKLLLPRLFKLGDGRSVEVRRIDIRSGAAEIEFVTR